MKTDKTKTLNQEILIAEDSSTQAEKLKYLLEENHYRVVVARDGKNALMLARQNKPMLIISDIVMPEMDGLTLCKIIKEDELLRDVPVVLVTSLTGPEDVMRGLQCGADNFIRKPYDEKHIVSRVRYILANRELRKTEKAQMGIELFLGGEKYFVTSERKQILDLLISTYEEAVHLNEELRESMQSLNALHHIAESLNRCTSEAEVIEKILEGIPNFPGIQTGWVLLREGESDFRLAGHKNLPPELQMKDAFSGCCAEQDKLITKKFAHPVNISDCKCFQKIKREKSIPFCHASIPLRAEEKIWGVLNLVKETEDTFTEQELKTLEGVGNQMTAALERASLHEHLERRVLKRTAALTAEIAERKSAEKKLKENEERYRYLVIATSQMVWSTDARGHVVTPQPNWEEYTGQKSEEVRGWGWTKSVHPEDVDRVTKAWSHAVKTQTLYEIECRIQNAQGEYRNFSARAVPVLTEKGEIREWIGTYTDITNRTRLEEELRQSQKMEAIGKLAGGIAHDFNNMLTIISSYAEITMREANQETVIFKNIEEIKKAAEKSAALTHQLLAFSRKQVLQPKVLDLNTIITNTQKMLRRLIPESIELIPQLSSEPAKIKVDPGQLEQVILNLVVNARDAMPEGGKITIETKPVVLKQEEHSWYSLSTPGSYWEMTVRDTGMGMSEETKVHIFEPFFTTKGEGKGTGLGLATVFGIVRQSAGYIELESDLGKGTAFRVYFPRVEEALEAEQSKPNTVPETGSETILLVEDEPAVRSLTRRILEANGYKILEAENGKKALEVCQEYKPTIHLLVTDSVLPGMSGRELRKKMMSLRPDMKVLYVSGYLDQEGWDDDVIEPQISFLSKPFTPNALKSKVREALNH